jgi:hypothetical protein
LELRGRQTLARDRELVLLVGAFQLDSSYGKKHDLGPPQITAHYGALFLFSIISVPVKFFCSVNQKFSLRKQNGYSLSAQTEVLST